MVDPYRVEAEYQVCGEPYELTSKKHDLDFLKDATAGSVDAVISYFTIFKGNADAPQDAAEK